MTVSSPHERKESEIWDQWFDSESGVAQRRREIPKKLRLLGLDRIPKHAAVLDLCCGRCESLETLYELGYHHLSGVDMHIAPHLMDDPRFQLQEGDATNPQVADSTKDWVIVLHALHHLTPDQTQRMVDEAYRILRPGGRLSIVDFPNSPQIRLAFFFFRHNLLLLTPYMKYYGKLVQEEWPFLKDYLPAFPQIERILTNGRFTVESRVQKLFLFFLTLKKPV